MVRQEGRAGQNPKAAGLESDSGCAQRPHHRDQVAADPAAGSRSIDRRAGRDRRGVVARGCPVGWAKAVLRRAHLPKAVGTLPLCHPTLLSPVIASSAPAMGPTLLDETLRR